MSETEFYQPGEPEYNPNDPMKPRAEFIIEQIEKEDELKVAMIKNAESAVHELRGTVAGMRSRMQQLSDGLKGVLPHVGHDPMPVFEQHEVFPESDVEALLAAPNDNVNHPKHYNQYVGFEVIDVAKQLRSPDGEAGSNYFRGTVFKYLARAGWKVRPGMSRKEQIAKEIEDLEKGKFYLQAEIDRLYQKMEEAE